MPRTQTKGTDIGDGSICRTDLNTAIAGQAVITKIVEAASSGIKINASTGVEPGTGDVSFKVDQTMFAPLDKGTTAGQIPTWNGSKWTPSTPSSYEYWKIKATLKDTYCSFYNGYAFLNINIAALGWRVPSNIDYNTIITSLGGQNVAGGHLKEAGLTHWNSPNTGADNSSGFNALPCGQVMFGAYSGFGFIAVWATTTMNVDNPYCGLSVYVANSNGLVDISSQQMKTGGNSVRLIKNSTTLTNGQAGIYKGNDGKVYNTICIGGIEIMSENLEETKWRDGSNIPEVNDLSSAWWNLTTAARCSVAVPSTNETTINSTDTFEIVAGANINIELAGKVLTLSATEVTAANVGAAITGTTADTTLLDADFVPIITAGSLAKTTFTIIKSFLKTYFDTLYNKYVHPNQSGDVTSVADGVTTIAANAVTYAKQGAEFKTDLTITGNAIDWATGFYKAVTLAATTTFTFANLEKGKTIILKITGAFTLAFPASVTIISGTYTGAKQNYIILTCLDSATPTVMASIISV